MLPEGWAALDSAELIGFMEELYQGGGEERVRCTGSSDFCDECSHGAPARVENQSDRCVPIPRQQCRGPIEARSIQD